MIQFLVDVSCSAHYHRLKKFAIHVLFKLLSIILLKVSANNIL
jgi:hypothetical protein